MPRANVADIKRWLTYYDDINDLQDPPVQNTWYTILDVEDVRCPYCFVIQVNDETAAKTIEVRIIADGLTNTPTFLCVNNTDYWANYNWAAVWGLTTTQFQMMSHNTDQSEPLFARDLNIAVRMTDVPGTNQTLRTRARYALQEIT